MNFKTLYLFFSFFFSVLVNSEGQMLHRVYGKKNKQKHEISIKGIVVSEKDNKPLDYILIKVLVNKNFVDQCYTSDSATFEIFINPKYKDSLLTIITHTGQFADAQLPNISLKSSKIDLGTIYLKRIFRKIRLLNNKNDSTHLLTSKPYIENSTTSWQRFKRKIRRLF